MFNISVMVRLLEYWQRLEAEKREEEEDMGEEENEAGNQEFSLDIGNDTDTEVDVENNTGIKINIEDATPQKEVVQPSFENSGGIEKTTTDTEDEHTVPAKREDLDSQPDKDGDQFEEDNSLPFIDEQPKDRNEDEGISGEAAVTKDEETDIVSKNCAKENANSGYNSGMKKFFQNVSEAQQGDEGDFSFESRYSDEDSEIKNILGSGQKRDSKYIVKSEDETLKKSKCGKIPVLDTSESEFEESELSRAGFSNFAFDEKE